MRAIILDASARYICGLIAENSKHRNRYMVDSIINDQVYSIYGIQ
uniref:Uncharacterized protein n=1 Tax=Lepeophtheirus salmonis TaxID=72036 RepID=A0A0K2TRE9_LEPSM